MVPYLFCDAKLGKNLWKRKIKSGKIAKKCVVFSVTIANQSVLSFLLLLKALSLWANKQQNLKMGVEIERKFLLKNDGWRKLAPKGIRMAQWYLNESGNTVRVRIADQKAFLTIKSKSVGISRMEFEYEIPLADAESLKLLTQTPIVDKYRYVIPYCGHVWEVDEFLGLNEGLVTAEVEMQSEDEQVEIPDWIGEDVSDEKRYRNSNLAKHPFSTWKLSEGD